MSDNISLEDQQCIISRRVLCDYTEEEKEIMDYDKKIITLQINKGQKQHKSVIYPNQDQCASLIVSHLLNRKIIDIMVVALTQSGKTGIMCALIKRYINENMIPIDNIYIITGLSSVEWKEQTKIRLPESIENRIYHRSDLTTKFIKDIENKKNVFVISDEIQIAAMGGQDSKIDQTLYKAFKKAKFYDKKYLLENDIKIAEFTATPDGTIYDVMDWGDNSKILKMEPGDGYTSCFDLLDQGRVYQYKDLCCYDKEKDSVDEESATNNIHEISKYIETKAFDYPMYHIIRTPNGDYGDTVIKNFKKVFGVEMKYYTYNRESEITDINTILRVKPKEHTFIFIKEKLRCNKTLKKKYLGIVYERYTVCPDDTVVIQGLLGRATGYDDNGKTVIFTNINSIKRYKKLWDSTFQDKTVKWSSKTTKMVKDTLESKGTTLKSKGTYLQFGTKRDSSGENKEPIVKKFNNQKEVKDYYNTNLKDKFGGRGPNKREPNSEGYYTTTINKKNGGKGKDVVHSCDDVNKVIKQGLNHDHTFTFHPCYRDITDKSTLEFWLIHIPLS